MNDQRLDDYLAHIRESASLARSYVEGLSESQFHSDKRTQQAVILNLLIIGEAAAKVLDEHPDFAAQYASVPWRSMKGMRNRIAHGYFEIDVTTVWQTVQMSLLALLEHLPGSSSDLRDPP